VWAASSDFRDLFMYRDADGSNIFWVIGDASHCVEGGDSGYIFSSKWIGEVTYAEEAPTDLLI